MDVLDESYKDTPIEFDDLEQWFDPETGWLLQWEKTHFYGHCFSTGESLQMRAPTAKQLLEVNKGGTLSDQLVALKEIGPSPVKKLIQTAENRRFLNRPGLVDVLSLNDPTRLWLEVQGECNERCVHCYAGSAPVDLPELEPDLVDGLLEDAAEIGFDAVQFTGGDPLLWEELPEKVHRARELGLTPEIFTNGLCLSEDLYDRLSSAGPTLSFSLYSHQPDTHDQITGREGSWERTVSAVERALEGPTPVRVAISLMDENANHLPAIREFVSELGVAPESVGWNYVQSVGRGNDQPEAQVNRDKSDEQSNHGSSNRRFNPGKLCVTYRGEVVPCIFQRWLQLGNVHDRSLRNVVTDPKPEQINQDIPSGQLAENSYTCGECRFHYQFLRELVGV